MPEARVTELAVAGAHARAAGRGPGAGWIGRALATLLVAALAPPAAAQEPPDPDDPSPHSEASLVGPADPVRPGASVTVGLRLELDDGWHTYWCNPGDSGMPPMLVWADDSDGVAGPLRWPVPERIVVPPLVSYGYHDGVLLPFEVTVPPDAVPGDSVVLSARADWLVCTEICLPATGAVRLALEVGDPPHPAWAGRLQEALRRLPAARHGMTVRAFSEPDGYRLEVEGLPDGAELADVPFFAAEEGVLDHAALQPRTVSEGTVRLRLEPSSFSVDDPERLRGVLVGRRGDEPDRRVGWAVDVPLTPTLSGGGAAGGVSMPTALLFAVLGGVLLNLMPCVFPVLSIKILGFLDESGMSSRRARLQGLAYGAGVIVSFQLLAAALLLLRGGGQELGWGFQLQSPPLVAALVLLFVALGMALMGVVEMGLSLTRLAGSGRNAFLTGGLAVVVATPCTAPFMGVATGYALVQPPLYGLAVFTGLGVGMASPYVALSWFPGLLRRLPDPGPWMAHLKRVLALPLFGTAAWLLWVFARQTGGPATAILAAAVALVVTSGWIEGRRVQGRAPGPARSRARLASVATLGLALVSAGWASQRAAAPASHVDDAWEPFSVERVNALRAEGRPVFLDFTAAWCITCQVNERTALADGDVLGWFEAHDVALVRADWTSRDPEITRALREFGRSGVPLYVYYPPDAEPRVLPTLLTAGKVLSVLRGG